ncbi:hypothetical protein [Zavarzinia compransoris]|uniref:Uncharacterized protein n=1 Tax=Zavarzinia compransoris TaxID=1264899 RepID=A0A317E850_9PROT|nr:hypothetical protein [Zavarzinia compransoris]PWR23318.1 hypothetical protein DKG75_01750 [Zavarzinia compransoris]TDP46110.1 hypothetical protein DES42_104195 [Zavarzinia compransoris]
MAIDYFGHTTLPIRDAQRLIDRARREQPAWFIHLLYLYDAGPLGPFGAEIAQGFGIAARSRFMASVVDKERTAGLPQALEELYRRFGTARLIITWGLDQIHAPLAAHPGDEY